MPPQPVPNEDPRKKAIRAKTEYDVLMEALFAINANLEIQSLTLAMIAEFLSCLATEEAQKEILARFEKSMHKHQSKEPESDET